MPIQLARHCRTAKPSSRTAGAGDAAADPRRRQRCQEQRQRIKPHLKGRHWRAIGFGTHTLRPRGMPREVDRGRRSGAKTPASSPPPSRAAARDVATIAGERRCSGRRERLLGPDGGHSRRRGRGRLSLRPGWPVSHPARAAGAVGRRADQVRSSRRLPAGKARAGPKRLPRADHSRSPGRSGGLGRAVRATGGHPTVRHRKGSRAAMVRASRVNGLRGRVRPAREGRIGGNRARTIGGGGTGDRAADRREEVGKLR